MALDHYIPQVHLKKFCSPEPGDSIRAIRKSDLKSFVASTKKVCGIHNGSTNAYLRDDRAIEEFLKTIEPDYNAAVERLRVGNVDSKSIYTIAGFVAFVSVCSPGGIRLQSGLGKSAVAETSQAAIERGLIPPLPPELKGTDVEELFRAIRVEIDPKYPQAIGISTILEQVNGLRNFEWEILHNDTQDSPFFTSDFPIAIEEAERPRILNKVVPLLPDLAVRIRLGLPNDVPGTDFTFTNFRCRSRQIRHQEVVKLNRLIVRCAEELVFYRDDRPWVLPFINKNRRYRVETVTKRLKTPGGIQMSYRQGIVASAPHEHMGTHLDLSQSKTGDMT